MVRVCRMCTDATAAVGRRPIHPTCCMSARGKIKAAFETKEAALEAVHNDPHVRVYRCMVWGWHIARRREFR